MKDRKFRCAPAIIILGVLAGCSGPQTHPAQPKPATSDSQPSMQSKESQSGDPNVAASADQLFWRWRQKQLTIEEAKSAVDWTNENARRQWADFFAKYRPGDTIWLYSSPPELWEKLAGRAGYAIFRGRILVAEFTTLIN